MRTFIAILTGKAPAITQETADTPQAVADRLDPDSKGKLVLVEVPNGTGVSIPDNTDGPLTAVQLANFVAAEHTDVAGVQRSAAGRPVDAHPGSMDAALTGMQHDLGSGTVRNTTSPEPTPSKIIEEELRADPAEAKQPAPKAAQATTR